VLQAYTRIIELCLTPNQSQRGGGLGQPRVGRGAVCGHPAIASNVFVARKSSGSPTNPWVTPCCALCAKVVCVMNALAGRRVRITAP